MDGYELLPLNIRNSCKFKLNHYTFAGKMFACMMYQKQLCENSLNPVLWKQLMGRNVTMADLEIVDPGPLKFRRVSSYLISPPRSHEMDLGERSERS